MAKTAFEKESKALSYILRHGAKELGLPMTKDGFVFVNNLIDEMIKKFPKFNFATLEQIVAEDEKGRYSFNATKLTIRANQGHSLTGLDLKFEKKIPPVTLYHGTSDRNFEGIKKTGIQRMDRHHVHLTDDLATASSVGIRHGSELIIAIDTRDMVKDKIEFFLSDNGVWLTKFVDLKYFKEIIRP